MTDIYKPPASDVTKRSNPDYGNIQIFERFSTWYVLGLSVITLNLYGAYWLYTRTNKLNQIIHYKISNTFSQTTLILYVLSYVIYFGGLILEIGDSYFLMGSSIFDLVANILVLVWVYKFRNRLSETFSGEHFRIGIVLPFFLMHIYLQYKLNELIDLNQHNKRMQVDDQKAAPHDGG